MEYTNFEIEYLERSLQIIEQYDSFKSSLDSDKRYETTLLINSLLAVIVFPKEKVSTFLPKDIIDGNLKREMGINESLISPNLHELSDLLFKLRHAVAHIDFKFESDENNEISKIIFFDNEVKSNKSERIAEFIPNELKSFIYYYVNKLIANLRKYKFKNDN